MAPDPLWVLAFGATGIVVGLAGSLVGLRAKVEFPLWVAFYAGWITSVLLLDVEDPFWTVFLGSLLSGVLVGITQVALLPHYRRNNPWYADRLKGTRRGVAAAFLFFGIAAGLLFGAVVGGIAWGLSRL